MIFRLKSKAPVVMETIAFADIVINLFVFFFITFGLFATFDATKRGTLPIELPKVQYPAKDAPQNHLIVMIDREGLLYIGPQRVPLSELRATLNHELSLRKEKNVAIRAHRTISLERFVSVLDVVRTTKAKAVSIETEI